MAKQSTNRWTLERSRGSVNVLLKKAGMEPLLVEVLSDLLWVVDHQQDELERMRKWVDFTISQACHCQESMPFGHFATCPVFLRNEELHRLPNGDYDSNG